MPKQRDVFGMCMNKSDTSPDYLYVIIILKETFTLKRVCVVESLRRIKRKDQALTGNETVLTDNVWWYISSCPVSGLCGLIINILTTHRRVYVFQLSS